jgi:hypothetical protein
MEQHTNLSLTILEVFVLCLILTQEMLFKKWIMMNSVILYMILILVSSHLGTHTDCMTCKQNL